VKGAEVVAAQKLKVLIVELSSCVALTPRRETHGDESAMNRRGKHLREAYSPKCLEGRFSEVHMQDPAYIHRPEPRGCPEGAFLDEADLREADLRGARGWTEEQQRSALKSLEGATTPNGQKYEDWLESRDREEDGENSGPS
jgi:hypothetical protein